MKTMSGHTLVIHPGWFCSFSDFRKANKFEISHLIVRWSRMKLESSRSWQEKIRVSGRQEFTKMQSSQSAECSRLSPLGKTCGREIHGKFLLWMFNILWMLWMFMVNDSRFWWSTSKVPIWNQLVVQNSKVKPLNRFRWTLSNSIRITLVKILHAM